MKIRIERREGDAWLGIKVNVGVSRNGNMYAKHHVEASDGSFVERVLVWADEREGTPVVEKVAGKWVQVGRLTKYGEVFLGEGMSYGEYARSPEGLEASRKALESLQESRFPKTCNQPIKKLEFSQEV